MSPQRTDGESNHENVVVLVFNGQQYRMNLPDLATDYIQKKLANEGQPYESEMLKDIQKRIKPGDLIIDVGANIGNHTICLAAVGGCKVEAFEPNQHLCEAMKESVEINGLGDKVRIHNLGVGSSTMRATFEKTLPDNLGAQRLLLGEGAIGVVALDSLNFSQPVKVIKIDVEGMEIEVLRGSQKLIDNNRPLLYIECISDRDFHDVSQWLDEQRYVYWDSFNLTPTHLFIPAEGVSLDRRLSRIQLQIIEESYRRSQLSLDVRKFLKRSYDNERAPKENIIELKHEHEQTRNALRVVERERDHLTSQLNVLHEDRNKIQRMYQLSIQRVEQIEDRLKRTKSYISYQVGEALVQSTQSISMAIKLPVRLWRLSKLAKQRRNEKQSLKQEKSKDNKPGPQKKNYKIDEGIEFPQATDHLISITKSALTPVATKSYQFNNTVNLRQISKYLGNVSKPGSIRVACIFDEFTYHSFAPECELFQLKSDVWKQQIEEFKPDIIFIESVWRGMDDSWFKKVSDLSDEILALLEWATKTGVPTAFWCKEDPVHFSRFLPVARLVDHVFTTDIDCVAKYKDALKHESVYLLPFAAQPALHNPIEKEHRADAFCFAGSFYAHYPDRQQDFHSLVTVGRKLRSVEIFDRNADRPQPHNFGFPQEYQQEIRGSLPYANIDRAYKGYRYGITVNTIKQSQTMFARRAFELMACNTVVVSNFSKGLRLFFGDLVIASDNCTEIERRLAPLCADESLYRQHRLRALRNVLTQHTYEHRFAYVLSKLAGQRVVVAHPRVCMFGEPANAADAIRLLEFFSHQKQPQTALVLVGCPIAVPKGIERVHFVSDRAALIKSLMNYEFVAPLCAGDYYGPDYVSDMVLATKFARGDAVTKATYFNMLEDGTVRLAGGSHQYHVVPVAQLRCSLIRTEALLPMLSDSEISIALSALSKPEIVALDEFSYCRNAQNAGAQFDHSTVDLPQVEKIGIDYVNTAQSTAERIAVPDAESGSEGPLVLSAEEWLSLIPKAIDPRLEIDLNDASQVELRSKLEPDDHQYIYFTRRFTVEELRAERESFFQLEAEVRLDLRTVFVFFDAAEKKISHVMHTVGARYALQVPTGTQTVKLALRIQGGGQAKLGNLRLAESRGLPLQVIPSAHHLIVSNQYPDYDDLYRYGFVHARVRAYAQAGVPVEVLRLSGDPKIGFREFENVDVVEADHTRLEQCLVIGQYTSVLIHILDQRMWSVVRKYLDHIRIIIWAHGAEIQPWWRRAMNFSTDALRDQARRTSDARLDMWREILCLKHPNLHIVFISNKQLNEVLSDLRIRPEEAGGVEIISNFIDGELFQYAGKDATQRSRVLSIRPFASRVYANDLSVAAILQLEREPFFKDMRFKIVGDGALFEETVKPIRHLPNVELTQAFLTQRQIAELHREYGVFLVPSRMDSQGVSRDEAMSSGLVPVTTRIAAIPEFVDDSCAMLAEPEDANGLAQAIKNLYEDPAQFKQMSIAASQRVRSQSGYAQTISRELALLERHTQAASVALEKIEAEEALLTRIAIYGDINLNIMDGSAIWAASLAETLCGIGGVRVTMLLKTRIHRTQVIARLLDLTPQIQLVEPYVAEKAALTPIEAIAELVGLDVQSRYRSFVLRGLDLCCEAARTAAMRGRIWAYLTDIPQRADQMDSDTHDRISLVIENSEYILCQTPEMQAYFIKMFPQSNGRTRILPPMIPPLPKLNQVHLADQPFRICYAGKFAPRWGIREMFRVFEALRARHPDTELHAYGDKIHNPPEDPEFRSMVSQQLTSTEGLIWHGAVDRDELTRQLQSMHVCWAYRDPVFERETLELSTKALEYALLGIPMILARSPVYEGVFGRDYMLFADSEDEALQLLERLYAEPEFRATIAAKLTNVALQYTFPSVRTALAREGLIGQNGPV